MLTESVQLEYVCIEFGDHTYYIDDTKCRFSDIIRYRNSPRWLWDCSDIIISKQNKIEKCRYNMNDLLKGIRISVKITNEQFNTLCNNMTQIYDRQ